MPTKPALPPVRTIKPSATLKYDPEPQRDWVRAAITLGLIVAFLMVIGLAFYATHGEYDKTVQVLDKLLPALTGLIGSALGFYFGSRSHQN